jgi:hypothetical protein
VQLNLLTAEQVSFISEYFENYRSKFSRSLIKALYLTPLAWTVNEFMSAFCNYSPVENLIPPFDYHELLALYLSISGITKALLEPVISSGNFKARCTLLSPLIHVNRNEISEYFDTSTLSFRLFTCLYDLIFEKMESKLNFEFKQLLYRRTGLSDKWPQETFYEVNAHNNISVNTQAHSEKDLDGRITKLISRFTLLTPYFHYPPLLAKDSVRGSDFPLLAKERGRGEVCLSSPLIITPETHKSITRLDSAPHITQYFIAKAFSIIYGYKRIETQPKGSRINYLIYKD